MVDPERRRFRQIRALTEASRALARACSAGAIHAIVVSAARELTGASRVVLLLNDEQERPVVRSALGLDPALLAELRDAPQPSFDEGIARALRGAARVVSAPLIAEDRVAGVLSVARWAEGADDEAWLLPALADQAAVALAAAARAAPPEAAAHEAAAQRDAGGAAARGSVEEQQARLEADVERGRYRLLARVTKESIWDWDIRNDQVERNETFYELFRYTPEQADPSGWWWLGRIVPEDHDRVARGIEQVIHGDGDSWSAQYRVVRGDGSIARVLDRGYVLRDAAGEAIRMVGSTVDLTERLRMESALRDREDRLRLATWAADVGTWSVDLETWDDTRDASLNRILGLEERETTQPMHDWMSRVHPEDRDAVIAMTERCVREHGVYDIVHRIVRADGAVRWVHDRGRIVHDAERSTRFLTGAVVDITGLKQLEEERAGLLCREQQALAQSEKDRLRAEDANRMKDEFLATVSHELRTPLTAILGWARLIKEKDLGPERVKQGMAAIERNAHAQAQIVDDILTVSRIITGKLRLNTVAVDLAAVIEAAVDTLAPTARAKEIEISVDLDEELGHLSGDPDRLQQVMWNLLSNAVKFTPKRGRVAVRAARSEAQVVIAVTDNGKGIAPGLLPYVFDRFRQGDSSPTRAHGGLGLGLAIVRHLVELHGGTAEAESPGDGRGATFTVTLPAQAAASSAHDGPPAVPRPVALDGDGATPLRGLHVLLVEDEPDAREMLAFLLEETGAQVTTAGSTGEAMRVLERLRPDVLVSDIGMPGESGYTLIQQVRAAGRAEIRGIPAVALTAYARIEDRRRALAAGFQRHVPKPIDPSGLVKVIADLAGRP
ncbi:hybrid sensor histidine kinase/response regulator [Sorangium sp. So ce854]|uniref:hybrid sensor histidine kinase/response regulator n=1 Tax=Sorangium sp. So ce854 TaxID=3133322 RepID=UPI003F5DF7AF